METDKSNPTLQQKVTQWLSQEGYPLEFFTATTFRRHGFRVWQGQYAEDSKTSTVREIDVIACADREMAKGFLRVEHVVECKWTKDKPWVVFCSKSSSMAMKACIAQTIASKLGQTILWLISDDKRLHKLTTFATPLNPGFGGRQVFSKDNDSFYTAIQSVISKAKSEADEYDAPGRRRKKFPDEGGLFLPLIVIEGQLFEASYDETTQAIAVKEVSRTRLHWMGSETWRLHATVDIVVRDHLEDFVAQRKAEMDTILDAMYDGYQNIVESFQKQSLNALNLPQGSTASEVPPLLVPLTHKKIKRIVRRRRK